MSSTARRRRTPRRATLAHGLIITSMVDMFTLVLLFLLMFYDPLYDGSSPVELPSGDVQAKAQGGPTITVTTENIVVNGKPVAAIRDGRLDSAVAMQGRAITALVASLSPLVPTGGAEAPAVSVECDRRVPWQVLGAVLESASQAGFPRYRFVVAGE